MDKQRSAEQSNKVEIVVSGPELDVKLLAHTRHKLSLSYLRRLRKLHDIAEDQPLSLEQASLPDEYGRTPLLRLNSESAGTATIAVVYDENREEVFMLTPDAITTEIEGVDELGACTAVRNALFDLRMSAELGPDIDP